MKVNNLYDLLNKSKITRTYFFTLTIDLQLQSHQYNEVISTSENSHILVDLLQKK